MSKAASPFVDTVEGEIDPIFIGIDPARRSIGCSRTLFYQMINEGLVETRKIGRRRVVVVASLRELPAKLQATA